MSRAGWNQTSRTIVKQECDPYEYTIKDTGEVILLDYRHVFMPDDQVPSKPQNVEADANVFSTNGIMEAAI